MKKREALVVVLMMIIAGAVSVIAARLFWHQDKAAPARPAGICYNATSGADRAYIVNGAVTCLDGMFIPVEPTEYHQ